MTAPEATAVGGETPDSAPPRAPLRVQRPSTIRKRRDFLAAARARKWAAKGMVVQGRQRREGEDADPSEVRVGYTCSKKVGNAVRRNRAKRRLRAVAEQVLPRLGRPGWEYVLIGKNTVTEERVFADLLTDLEEALARIHAPRKPK